MTEDTDVKDTILITRPRLVSFLMKCGMEPTPAPNPWNPEKRAWELERTPEAEALVNAFYQALREKEGRGNG